MGKPFRRTGFFGSIPKNPELALFTTFLGADTTLYFHFYHEDGYGETRPFVVQSVTRRKFPNPHIVRGVLEYDLNRPGEDCSDLPHEAEMVIELWSYPETFIYYASSYQPIDWVTFRELPIGSIFKFVEDGKENTCIKINDEEAAVVIESIDKSWIQVGEPERFYDPFSAALEVISQPST